MTDARGPARAVVLTETGPGPGGVKGPPTLLAPIAGIPLLDRMLHSLTEAGVREIFVVSGRHSGPESDVKRALTAIRDAGESTVRLIESAGPIEPGDDLSLLRLALEHFDRDLYLLRGNLVFDPGLLHALNDEGAEGVAAVGPRGPVPHVPIGAYLLRDSYLRNRLVPDLDTRVSAIHEGESTVVGFLAQPVRKLATVDVSGHRWCAVADVNDWMHADILFADPATAFDLINREYGRYQRAGAADHLVMTNVYFPSEAMRRELQGEFDALITDYPSAQRSLARLMAAVTDQLPEHILVANGASELIRAACGNADAPVVVPVPTYNEYEATVPPRHLVRLPLEAPGFEVDVERLADTVASAAARTVVLVSPNNPTGLAVPRAQIEWLAARLAAYGNVRLLLDESFVEFCIDPPAQTLTAHLEELRTVTIIKSFSMACGVPGLRLACLITTDRPFLESLRARIPVWNVNAVAEGFLRLLPRYRPELARTCAQVRRDCDELRSRLNTIPGVIAHRSDACFCLTRLPPGIAADDVALKLFAEHRILVKTCGGKSMPREFGYLRVKSRTPAENRYFTEALADVLTPATP